MKTSTKIVAVVLLVLLAVTAYGLLHTSGATFGARGVSTTSGEIAAQTAVDQTPLLTAQRLALLVSSADEQGLAEDALRIADHAVDLQFAQALRDVTEHPPALSAEAKEIQVRLETAENSLAADKAQVATLTAEEAKAREARKNALDDELELAKSRQELDEDEVDDAKQDLIRAGGDPEARIQQLVEAHKAASQNTPKGPAALPAAGEERGLIHRYSQWRSLRNKEWQLLRARADAEALVAQLASKHNALGAKLSAEKNGTSPGTPSATPGTSPSPAAGVPSPARHPVARSHDEAVSLLKNTQRRAVDQQALATFDKRIDDQRDLAEVYRKWSELVVARERGTVHIMLIGATIILTLLLIGLVFDRWLEKLLGKTSLDRRQVETLRTLTRVSLQIFAVLFILLVIFGPPSQLGTFLGLAGAGLTVALKDFIVGFLGWFVLMGKNGIRLGDWVEINGVTGEVVELGMFHTVLLETGNWTDSGHPTGRRVTFTNGFAIENHYFNFSTSGQWLWDELQVVIPAGQDPYPIVAAIQEKVTESTAAGSEEAEAEWKQASSARSQTAMSAAPAINVKPVVGGVEISVRYITRANERYQLRAKLYHAAVDLLGKAALPAPPGETSKKPDA
ncbi:MAG: mechanosensitive ion channel domain-containing protein [Candidatus Acidiferrum sp.]|jgi:small-conductance mechanosensitive channel